MIHFLEFQAWDMFWTGKWIKYDKPLEIFPARDMFWTGELIHVIASWDFQVGTCFGQVSG